MTGRFVALAAVIVALLATVSFAAASADVSEGAVDQNFMDNGFQFKITSESGANNEVDCVTYTGVAVNVVIPGNVSFNGKTFKVTSVSGMGKTVATVEVPNGVTAIGAWAFSGCTSMTSVTLPPTLVSIGDNAFYNCSSLEQMPTIANVKIIGENAFAYCRAIESVTLPPVLTTLGKYSFSYCDSLSGITIPDSLTFLNDGVFSNCESLASISLNNNLVSIGESAFYQCTALKSVTIPGSVLQIGNYSFYGCASLTSVTIESSAVPSPGTQAFSLGDASKPVTVNMNVSFDTTTWKANKTAIFGNHTTPVYAGSGTGTDVEPGLKYTVNVSAKGGGSVTPSGDCLVTPGASFTVTLKPDFLFKVRGIYVGEEFVPLDKDTYTITSVQDNATLVADFELSLIYLGVTIALVLIAIFAIGYFALTRRKGA